MSPARISPLPEPPSNPDPPHGRLGWFEGVRENHLCGWTYHPEDTHQVFDVTLGGPGGASLTVRADRLRADLQAAGLMDGYHGFSIPLALLPAASRGALCVWSDLGVALPGSPWSPARRGVHGYRAGPVRMGLDLPLTGDPRVMGYAIDTGNPLRRLRLGAIWNGIMCSRTTASLYRHHGEPGDGFHGFILRLPAPLDSLQGGVTILDIDDERVLATLEPRSL